MILLHPTINQLILGQVYTRDMVTNVVYVQHYQMTDRPIEFYTLKSTRYNSTSKGIPKYASTMDTSTIIKCQGCQLHQDQSHTEAIQ